MRNGRFGIGKTTQNANTVIVAILPGKRRHYTNLEHIKYTSTTTAHTLTVMKSVSSTTLAAAMPISCTTFTMTAVLTDGGGANIAGSDYVAIELSANNWLLDTVSSVNTTSKVVTLSVGTSALQSAPAGAKVVCFGAQADNATFTLATIVNAVASFPSVVNEGALARSRERNDPIMLHSNNATNAGTLDEASCSYSRQP